MKPVQHSSSSRVLRAAKSHDQSVLPIADVHITDTMVKDKSAIIVFYEATDEERRQIAAGALIGVWVIGVTMPPIALTVQVDK